MKRLLLLLLLSCLCALVGAPAASPAPQIVINHPLPTISSFNPSSAVAGSPSFTMTISGNNFVEGATVTFGGQSVTIQDLGLSQIVVFVPSSSLVQAGLRQVSVTNPPPGGGMSAAQMPFQVIAPPPRQQ
jgi:hypothetical protein